MHDATVAKQAVVGSVDEAAIVNAINDPAPAPATTPQGAATTKAGTGS